MSYFAIRETSTAVELWTGRRIQFQGMMNGAWQEEAKAALKAALARLVPLPGSALSGYYDSSDLGSSDVENSLFTNFLECMPKGVRFLSFERGPSCPPTPPTHIDLVANHLHYYRYQANCQWATSEPHRTLARWNRVPRRMPGDLSARPTWFAMREANNSDRVELTGEPLPAESVFGIKVIIHATKRGPHNAIVNSESVVDGIIAAFHNDTFSDDAFRALVPKFPTIPADDLRRALDRPIGPLFDTPAINHSNNGFIQISPADERCRIGELLICNDSTSQWPEMSGELFTVRPAKAQ